MIECTRRIEFDAAHRIMEHNHKCKFLHGHRYALEITAKTEKLNELGMVVDFSILKDTIKNWVDKYLDHTTILNQKDMPLGNFIEQYTGQKVYYLPYNPTAENIASHIKIDILPKLFNDLNLIFSKVKLYETPNCFVEV